MKTRNLAAEVVEGLTELREDREDYRALIDGDIFLYSFGSATDDEGHPLKWNFVAQRLNGMIDRILDQSRCSTYQIYLTGKGNFRIDVATIKPYKGQRPKEKPFHYKRVWDYLIKYRKATVIEGIEADDQLSIELYNNKDTVLCSIDKDLDNTPGWHYNWLKEKLYYVDELTSLKSFYCQLLTGDGIDNILGLFGVGKSSKLLSTIRELDTELGMYMYVHEQYKKRLGSYASRFLLENFILLWMKRRYEYINPEDEAIWRVEVLERQREGQNWKTRLLHSLMP